MFHDLNQEPGERFTKEQATGARVREEDASAGQEPHDWFEHEHLQVLSTGRESLRVIKCQAGMRLIV